MAAKGQSQDTNLTEFKKIMAEFRKTSSEHKEAISKLAIGVETIAVSNKLVTLSITKSMDDMVESNKKMIESFDKKFDKVADSMSKVADAITKMGKKPANIPNPTPVQPTPQPVVNPPNNPSVSANSNATQLPATVDIKSWFGKIVDKLKPEPKSDKRFHLDEHALTNMFEALIHKNYTGYNLKQDFNHIIDATARKSAEEAHKKRVDEIHRIARDTVDALRKEQDSKFDDGGLTESQVNDFIKRQSQLNDKQRLYLENKKNEIFEKGKDPKDKTDTAIWKKLLMLLPLLWSVLSEFSIGDITKKMGDIFLDVFNSLDWMQIALLIGSGLIVALNPALAGIAATLMGPLGVLALNIVIVATTIGLILNAVSALKNMMTSIDDRKESLERSTENIITNISNTDKEKLADPKMYALQSQIIKDQIAFEEKSKDMFTNVDAYNKRLAKLRQADEKLLEDAKAASKVKREKLKEEKLKENSKLLNTQKMEEEIKKGTSINEEYLPLMTNILGDIKKGFEQTSNTNRSISNINNTIMLPSSISKEPPILNTP